MQHHPSRVLAALVVAAALGWSAVACTTVSTTQPPPTPTGADRWAETDWWAFGDSIFAGESFVPGAPAHLQAVNASVGGTTLVPVTILGRRQLDLTSQIGTAVERSGRPRHAVISAGMADLYARQLGGVTAPVAAYTARFEEVHAWLTSLGIDVHWMTLPPTTPWSPIAGQEPVRVALNEWLRGSGLPIVDCESSLQAPGSSWLDPAFTLARDGVHHDEEGARVYARCISDAIGVPMRSDGPPPTVPDTTVPGSTGPDTTVPDTTVPDTSVPDSTVPDTTVPAP